MWIRWWRLHANIPKKEGVISIVPGVQCHRKLSSQHVFMTNLIVPVRSSQEDKILQISIDFNKNISFSFLSGMPKNRNELMETIRNTAKLKLLKCLPNPNCKQSNLDFLLSQSSRDKEFKRECLRETSYKQGGNSAKILELGRQLPINLIEGEQGPQDLIVKIRGNLVKYIQRELKELSGIVRNSRWTLSVVGRVCFVGFCWIERGQTDGFQIPFKWMIPTSNLIQVPKQV